MRARDYGRELLLDLRGVEPERFTRDIITQFLTELCDDVLNVQRHDLHFWDYDTPEERARAAPHLAGVTAVQFLSVSNVTIHTLDKVGAVLLNIFTCGELDHVKVLQFCKTFWDTDRAHWSIAVRGRELLPC